MKFRSALLASAMMALATAGANAQAINGPYVAGGLGVNLMQREGVTISSGTGAARTSNSGDIRVNVGPAAVLSLGWGFGNGLRAEIEADYKQDNGFSDPQGY